MADIEKIKKDILIFLKDEFPEADIKSEFGAPGKFVIHIISEKFIAKTEETRQDDIWRKLHKKFDYDEYKHIGFIMTWTAEELEFYEQEYGEAIANTTTSK